MAALRHDADAALAALRNEHELDMQQMRQQQQQQQSEESSKKSGADCASDQQQQEQLAQAHADIAALRAALETETQRTHAAAAAIQEV
jgi:hypothetical protein